jgi:hypothetical protein
MKREDVYHLHPVIDRKLSAAARSEPRPPWYDAWSRLGGTSPHEERLKVCQAIRDAGTVPTEAGYFLVSWAVEYLAEDEDSRCASPLEMMNIFEGIRASERTFPALLEKHGEAGMAALFRTDPREHDRRREMGRQFFFGAEEEEAPVDMEWLRRLIRAVADSVVAREPVASLAFRCGREGDPWLVHVCPPGGADDLGAQGWAVDIERLREAFDKIDGCGWYAAPAEKGERPYLWVEGEFDGQEVFLRALPAFEEGQEHEVWRRAQE